MRERPIIMGADSVRSILGGRKTQTRRVVNSQPEWFPEVVSTSLSSGLVWPITSFGCQCGMPLKQKYYIGDRLWVREAWAQCSDNGILYKADSMFIGCEKGDFAWDWKSPLFMQRWASRITLEITDIRVERLQDITEEDAIAEGCSNRGVKFLNTCVYPPKYESVPIAEYCTLWQKLNAKRGYPWESNPWVWCIGFKRVHDQKEDV